jgi:hypothetical protein
LDSGSQSLIFSIIVAISFVVAVSISFVPANFSPLVLVLAVISFSAALVAYATKDYFFLIRALPYMKNNIAVIDDTDPYYLAPNGSAILVRKGDTVYATAFIKVPSNSSATEMDDEQKYNFALLFGRLVSISKTPMRISSQLHSINKDEYIAKVTARLNDSEARYNTLQSDSKADPKALERVKGEVTMWRNMLDNVSRTNSQDIEVYASVTAVGNSEDEATNLVAIKADEAAAGISATLGITATVAQGNEILTYIEPDYMIPPATIGEVMKYQATRG